MALNYDFLKKSKSKNTTATGLVMPGYSDTYAGNQVEYLQQKLLANGQDPMKALDTRNPLEKTLNLTPDQNFIFDIFEILGRPQQGLFTGLNNAAKGEDFSEGFMKGLKGQETTSGGDLIRTHFGGDEEKFGLDDVAGFALDVFLDPMDLIGVGLVGDAAKAAGAIDDVADAGRSLKVGLKPAFTKMGQDLTTPTEAVFKVLGATAKKGIGLADKGVEAYLGKMAAPGSLDLYKDLKNNVTDIFNSNSRLDRDFVRKKANAAQGGLSVGTEEAKSFLKQNIESFKNILADDNNFVKELADMGADINDEEVVKDIMGAISDYGSGLAIKSAHKDGFTLDDMMKVTTGPSANKEGSAFLLNNTSVSSHLKRFDKKFRETFATDPDVIKQKYPNLYTEVVKNNKTTRSLLRGSGKNSKFLAIDNPALAKEIGDFSRNYADVLGKMANDVFDKSGFFGQTMLSPTVGKLNMSPKEVRDLLVKHGHQDLVNKYMSLTRDTYGQIDKRIAGVTQGVENNKLKGSWQKNKLYNKAEMNAATREALGETQDNLKQFSSRKITNIVTPSQANAIYKELLDDPTFLPNITDPAKRAIIGEGFFDTGAAVVDNLYDSINPEKGYALKVKQTTVFNDYIKNQAGKNLIDEFNEFQKVGDPTNISSSAWGEQIRKSDSSLHYLPKGASLPKTIKNTMVQVSPKTFLGQLKSVTRNIDSNFGSSELYKGLTSIAKSGGSILMDKHVAHYLDLLKDDNAQNQVVAMTRVINEFNNFFKRGKLLSPGFNIRNIVGNSLNMLYSGIPPADIVSGMTKSMGDVQLAKKAKEILQSGKLKAKNLDSKMLEALQKVNELNYAGFSEAGTYVQGMEDIARNIGKAGSNKVTDIVNKINNLNIDLNNQGDLAARLTVLEYAKNNKDWMKRMGFKDVGEAVAFSVFDPGDLSLVEKSTIKKVIPFYTFAKKNIAYHIQNLPKNGRTYYEYKKALDSLWDMTGLEDEEISSYRKNNMEIPIPFFPTKDGDTATLNFNNPFTDVLELVDNPMNKVVNMTSPLIRAPFEAGLNINTYTGRPISEFKGQDSDLLSRTPLDKTFLDNAYAEWGLSNVGLDTPLKTSLNIWDLLTGDTFQDTSLSNMRDNFGELTGVVKKNNATKAMIAKDYENLEKLNAYIDYLSQQGVELQGLKEINNQNSKAKLKLNELSTSLQFYLDK